MFYDVKTKGKYEGELASSWRTLLTAGHCKVVPV